ncbi:MAG: flagellar biosynthesis protein FlhF [Syntrophobacterales bacterium]|nr:flagellar biosynthesis protein FlhF [Syntrophobacterales bacterium]
MQIKRYEALSANEAMEKIKADLGPDAIVLSSKRVNGNLEVVAARDDNYEIPRRHEAGKGEKEGADTFSLLRSDINELKSFIVDFKREGGVYAELAELKETMGALLDVLGVQGNGEVSSPLSKVYYHLISVGVSKERACALIEELKNDGSTAEPENYHHALSAAEDAIKRSITPSYRDLKKKRISAFVGPAGEGKTTTLAKLAARRLFEEKLNVGIITMDTYRIGAAEQLKTYANIMNVPMEIASEKKEFERALNRFDDRDVILVDTPGKSRGDENYLLKLKECLETGNSLETNLVLSMTSSRENMMGAATRFGIAGYNNIIFTKLDDSRKSGSIYDVIDHVGKPVFYVANGQNVPRDLKKMDPTKLARLIVGGVQGSGVRGQRLEVRGQRSEKEQPATSNPEP